VTHNGQRLLMPFEARVRGEDHVLSDSEATDGPAAGVRSR
jgi:hypothetical protein